MSLYVVEYDDAYSIGDFVKVEVSTYSVFEAKLIFIRDQFSELTLSHGGYILNRAIVLTQYYRVESKYIQYLDLVPNHYFVKRWYEIDKIIKSFMEDITDQEQIKMLNELLGKINLKIPSIIDFIKLKNEKIIKNMIIKGYFHLNAYKYVLQPKLTHISIERIFKRIRNTNYWHIWRLFKN